MKASFPFDPINRIFKFDGFESQDSDVHFK